MPTTTQYLAALYATNHSPPAPLSPHQLLPFDRATLIKLPAPDHPHPSSQSCSCSLSLCLASNLRLQQQSLTRRPEPPKPKPTICLRLRQPRLRLAVSRRRRRVRNLIIPFNWITADHDLRRPQCPQAWSLCLHVFRQRSA